MTRAKTFVASGFGASSADVGDAAGVGAASAPLTVLRSSSKFADGCSRHWGSSVPESMFSLSMKVEQAA